MARGRTKGQAHTADEPKRRITGPISASLFKRVAAYRGYVDRDLGDVLEEALTSYLAGKRFSIGSTAEPADEQAA